MLTIRLNADYILQIHKNQVNTTLTGAEELVFTDAFNGRMKTIGSYGFTSLQNCYLLTIATQALTNSDMGLELQIIGANDEVIYTSKVTLIQ